MFGGSDPSASYEANCDYILTLRYTAEEQERIKKDLIVPGRIPVNCGLPAACFKEGMKVGVKWHPWLPGKVVVDSPEVRKRQTGLLAYCGWVAAALACGAVMLSWLISG